MNEDQFWTLIKTSKEDDAVLQKKLESLAIEDIFIFHRIFHEKIRDAYRWDIWAVAYIMNGGCSDDGFDYFLGWLIGRGRKIYEATLQNPEKAATLADPEEEPFENEDLWYVASKAYQKKTGKDDFYDHAKTVVREIQGEPWEEESVAELYPKLAKRFDF